MPVFGLFKRLVGSGEGSERRDRDDERVRATLGARVLVVDDSATIRVVLAKMLMQDGYEVYKASDGETAIEMAQTQFPDLIFLDIVLPGMSGFAVLRAFRRDTRTHAIPIIMMSGNQQATEQFYVQRFGADGFIKKPFGRAEVFHAIRSLVQAGRMPARVDLAPAEVIPEGITTAEWDAIPDVAMPDDIQAEPPLAQLVTLDDEADVAPMADDTSAITQHVPAAPPLAGPQAPIVKQVAPSAWSLPARSMPMQPMLTRGPTAPDSRMPTPVVPAQTESEPVRPEDAGVVTVESALSPPDDDRA